jgi:hypothetical protein
VTAKLQFMTERGITSSLNTVLVAGQSVRPPPTTFTAPVPRVNTAPNYYVNTAPPVNVFLTEVAIDGGAPPHVSSPVHQIRPSQLREPRYSTITSKAPVRAGRNSNTKCLPPVQNLTHMAIASYRRQENQKIRNKQIQQQQQIASTFGVVTHGLHDTQYSKPKQRLNNIPLRDRDERSFQKHLTDLHAELSGKKDFSTNFGKLAPKRGPSSTYSGEGSVSSYKSAPPTSRSVVSSMSGVSGTYFNDYSNMIEASSHLSEVSAHSAKSTTSIKQPEQQNDEVLPLITTTQENEEAPLDEEFDHDDAEGSIISEPYSTNSYSTTYSSVVSRGSRYSDVTRSSAATSVSGSSYYSIGSDADHDRIIQLEDSLRNEELAARKVQKQLADIQAKQQALMNKLDPSQREKLEVPSSSRSKSRNTHRSRKSESKQEEQETPVDDNTSERKRHRRHNRRRHRHRSEQGDNDDNVSVVSHRSVRSVQMEHELKEKEKEINRLQGLMTEMASTIAKSDPKMLQVLKSVVDETKPSTPSAATPPTVPNNSSRSKGSIYSNKSTIVFG